MNVISNIYRPQVPSSGKLGVIPIVRGMVVPMAEVSVINLLLICVFAVQHRVMALRSYLVTLARINV